MLNSYFGKNQFGEIWTQKMKVVKAVFGAHTFMFLNKMEDRHGCEIAQSKVKIKENKMH